MNVLVTFSSPGWERTRDRFQREAQLQGHFSNIVCTSENDIIEEGWPKHRLTSERGFGYWSWKPIACLRAIRTEKMKVSEDTSDVLCWADVGSTFVNSTSAKKRFKDYKHILQKNGWLIFNLSLVENKFTKESVFDHMQAHKYKNNFQFFAGIFMMRTTPTNVDILNEWRTLCEHPNLIADEGTSVHRHDQSLLSVLLHTKGIRSIPDETNAFNAVILLRNSVPILATRIRKDGILNSRFQLHQLQGITILIYVLLCVLLYYSIFART